MFALQQVRLLLKLLALLLAMLVLFVNKISSYKFNGQRYSDHGFCLKSCLHIVWMSQNSRTKRHTMNQVVYKQACQTALHLSASHLPNENGSVLQNNRFQTSEFFN